jgi:TonB-dependent receptor
MRLALAIRAALFVLPLSAMADSQWFVYGYNEQGITDSYQLVAPDGRDVKPAANGAAALTLKPGSNVIKVKVREDFIAEITLEAIDKAQSSLLITMKGDQLDYVVRDGKTQETLASGTVINPAVVASISGVVSNAKDGAPMVGANVELSGSGQVVQSDAEGRYRFDGLTPGSYSLLVDAEGMSPQVIEIPELAAKQAFEQAIVLSAPGAQTTAATAAAPEGEERTLGSVEVTGQQQGSQAQSKEEERVNTGVAEVVSSEELSKGGESEVSAALKRVTGLSVVGGKFVYVRGLGERYSSVLLNGAQLPSPDPLRRVIPLDLFPTEVLDSVLVQKNYETSLPGEFGGGTVILRTKEAPRKLTAKLGLGISYLDGSSFENGLRYRGGSDDWSGFDDVRSLPSGLSSYIAGGQSLSLANPTQLEQFGEELAALGFNQRRESLPANGSLSGSIGGSTEWDEIKLSGLYAMRYAHAFNSVDEVRKRYATSDADSLFVVGEFDRERTERNIDLSNFVNLGAEFGTGQRLQLTSVWVRQSIDQAQADAGYDDSPDTPSLVFENEWVENAMLANQLLGQHYFSSFHEMTLDWQVTKATAQREAPARRRYRYERRGDEFVFSRQTDGNEITFENLDDDSTQYKLGLSLPYYFGEASVITGSFGLDRVERERESDIRRFIFTPQSAAVTSPAILRQSLDQILVPANIGPGGFNLREVTRPIDNYDAEQTIDALYLSGDLNLDDIWRINLGFRFEDNQQDVRTFDLLNPVLGEIRAGIDENDVLPALSVTRTLGDSTQLRFAYARTLSRPDFRELSPAPFFDPTLDVESSGNPNLQVTKLDNFDLRYEFYYTPEESVSAALFYKDFQDPIERTVKPGTGGLLTYENAESARNYGIEFEGFKRFDFLGERFENYVIGGNLAMIESNVELGSAGSVQTNRERPLQGQSSVLFNLELGYKPIDDDKLTWNVLYNVAGSRIAQVGILGLPDIKETPFHQLDFTLKWQFQPQWSLGVKLKNILDEEVRFEQGGQIVRGFSPGPELSLSVEWRPFN